MPASQPASQPATELLPCAPPQTTAPGASLLQGADPEAELAGVGNSVDEVAPALHTCMTAAECLADMEAECRAKDPLFYKFFRDWSLDTAACDAATAEDLAAMQL